MLAKKKGLLGLSSIAVIILWAVGTVLLLIAIALLVNRTTTSSEELICRNSVALRAKSYIGMDLLFISEFIKKEKFTPLMCNPQPMGELKGTREEIKHQIAELTAKCWWMYLEGSVPNLFKLDEEDAKSCGICYYFRIPEDLDAGEISSYQHFEEMIEEIMIQNIDRETDPEIREILLDNLNDFSYETIDYEGQKVVRPTNLISMQEFYNFLLSEEYNPGILYGGGTADYIGDVHEFTSAIHSDNEESLNLRSITEFPPTHLEDNTGLITQETQELITELGVDFFQQQRAGILVVVAEEIQRNDRRDARRLIERLGLNSDQRSNDGVLILIDINNGNIRLHMGKLLEQHIKEHEIKMILESHFGDIRNERELNRALQGVINDLTQKLLSPISEDRYEFAPGTYYEYLSNRQTTAPVIDNLQAGQTYAITYVSISDWQSWWSGMKQNKVFFYTAGGATLVVLTIATIKTLGATSPAAIAAAKGLWAASVSVASTAASVVKISTPIVSGIFLTHHALTDDSFADSFQALIGTLGTGRGDNSVMIVPASEVADLCDEVGGAGVRDVTGVGN